MFIADIGENLISGRYVLHSSFKKVKNYISDSEKPLLSLVVNQVGSGPSYIRLKSNKLPDIKMIEIKKEHVKLNDNFLRKDNIKQYNSKLDDIIIDNKLIHKALNVLLDSLSLFPKNSLSFLLGNTFERKNLSIFEETFQNKVRENTSVMNLKNLPNVCKNMKGLGVGLTPSGDDFNCGVLYALHMLKFTGVNLQDTINNCYKNSLGTNRISNTFLYYAHKGYFYGDFKEFIVSLSKDNKTTEPKKLLEHGHTSGADLLTGFILTIQKNLR